DAHAALAARAARGTDGATGKIVDGAVAVVVEAVAELGGRAGAAGADERPAAGLAGQRAVRAEPGPAKAVAGGILEARTRRADAWHVVRLAVAVVVDAVTRLGTWQRFTDTGKRRPEALADAGDADTDAALVARAAGGA